MKIRAAILLATALVSTSAMARNASVKAAHPKVRADLFGASLAFSLPPRMQLVTNKRNDTHLLMEFVPHGETLTTWTQMVTIQAYRGLGASPKSSAEIARAAFYPAACKLGPIYHNGGERTMPGGVKQSIIANGCAALPANAYPLAMKGAGEQDFIDMFRDDQTIYTLNYAVRGAPFAGKAAPLGVESAETVLRGVFGGVWLYRSE
jgi:hypothetical protein